MSNAAAGVRAELVGDQASRPPASASGGTPSRRSTQSICAGSMPARVECLARRLDAHHLHGLVRLGPAALDDARAGPDPLVGGVDLVDDLGVGDDPARPVAADAEDARRARRRCAVAMARRSCHSLSGWRRTRGWPGETRSPSSTIHSTTVPPCGASTGVEPRRLVDLADDDAGAPGERPSATSVGLVEGALGGRDEHPPGRCRVDRGGVAVLVGERAGVVELVGRLERERLHALELPLGDPDEGARRRHLEDAGDAEVEPSSACRGPSGPGC